MFPHGAQKVMGWFGGPGFTRTLEIFSQMGINSVATMALMFVELFGSILLILGFMTRIWALAFGFSLTICMMMNHVQHGFFMNWQGSQAGEGFEYHLLAIGICIALLARGGGMLSIDKSIEPKKRFRSLDQSL